MAINVEQLFNSILNESARYNETHGMLSENAEIKFDDSNVLKAIPESFEITEEELNADIDLPIETIEMIANMNQFQKFIESELEKLY